MSDNTGRVLASVKKANDLDTHVRLVTVDGVVVLELRDYIVSLGEYGRGYWLPGESAALQSVAQAMLQAAVEVKA